MSQEFRCDGTLRLNNNSQNVDDVRWYEKGDKINGTMYDVTSFGFADNNSA